jgi:UDP-N-acetylglucosamine 1-carboxyvinyltransferase
MVAATLLSGSTTVENVPDLRDTRIIGELLEASGCMVARVGDQRVVLDCEGLRAPPLDSLDRAARASRVPVLMYATLLPVVGSLPLSLDALGGCVIGNRPIDYHIEVLTALGARTEGPDHDRRLVLDGGRFRGGSYKLPYPSVGATEQFLLAAVRAAGTSILENAAIEPEVMNLVDLLQRMGGIVKKHPYRRFEVRGVEALKPAGIVAIPDRVEAASWACAALATDGEITVTGVVQEHLAAFLNVYRMAGGEFSFSIDGKTATFWRGTPFPQVDIETNVHPGFMTDWQPIVVTACTQVETEAVVHETVYEGRLGYLSSLARMGANVTVQGRCLGTPCRHDREEHSAVVLGPSRLRGAKLHAPDLRAGFALLIAALAAEGTSEISGFEVLDRGYSDLEAKLRALGADVRITSPALEGG